MILYIKRSIKFDLFSISGRFRKKSSDWNRKVTCCNITSSFWKNYSKQTYKRIYKIVRKSGLFFNAFSPKSKKIQI